MNKKIKKSFVVLMILSLCFSFSFQNISAQTLDENNNENISNKITQSEDDVGNNTVTGFEDLEEKIITINEKTGIEKLNLPNKLYVYLNNKEEKTSLDVSWECPDYDKKELSSYIFKPLFEDKYKVSPELSEEDIPTIEIKINKDIKTKEENMTRSTSSKSKKMLGIFNEFKIGSSETYKTLAEVITKIPNDAGDIVFNICSDLYTDYYKDNYIELPKDKNITSLTIKTDQPSVTIGNDTLYNTYLFLNGIKLTVDSGVTIRGDIYGGDNGKNITADTNITINENAVIENCIYGGSKNADLTGNSYINIKGKVSRYIFGGCHSYADNTTPNAEANMYGSSYITVEPKGCGYWIYGGNKATSDYSATLATTSTTTMSGSVNISMNGINDELYGGSYSGTGISPGPKNATCSDTIEGSIKIIYGATSRGYNGDYMALYGGSNVTGTNSDTNHSYSTIKGNIDIETIEDDNAAIEQDDTQAFNRYFGGGYAQGVNAVGKVKGNVTIKSAKPCWDSNLGLTGGGYAASGASIDVEGKTKIEIFKINNQDEYYENSNLTIGGGLCQNSDTSTSLNTTSTVGSSEIIIHEGATLIYGSTCNMNIIGRGYATGTNCNVDVKGSTSIKLERGIQPEQGICGGGMLYSKYCKNSSANVGSVKMDIRDDFMLNTNIIGGGYIYSALNASAKVNDRIDIKYGKNEDCSSGSVISGGYISNGFGDASIGSDKNDDSITINAGNGLNVYQFIGGSYVQKNTDESKIRITGNIKTNLEGGSIGYFLGGHKLSTSTTNAEIDGDIIHNISNITTTNFFYPGGTVYSNNADNPGKINISGNVMTKIENSTLTKQAYTGGGTYTIIEKNASVEFKDCTINTLICAVGSDYASIKGSSIVSLTGATTSNNYIYSYQGNATASVGKVLVEAGNEKGLQTKASIVGIYSTDQSNKTDVKVNKNAELNLTYTGTTTPYHLMNVYDIDIEKDGALITKSAQNAPIKGSLSGEGTITMPVGGKIIGSGTLGGNLTLKITGTLNKDIEFFEFDKSSTGKVNFTDPDYKYYLKKEIGSDKAIWVLKEGIIINTTPPDNGTITPSGKQMIGKDEPTEFTFTPDYGYQLDDVKVNGVSVKSDLKKHEDLRSSIYTLTTDINTSLEVSFRPLDKDTMEDIINNLPKLEGTTNPSENETNKIFDAKLDYEALSEDEKNKIDEKSSDKLHEDLLKATEIEVELSIKVSTSGNDAIKISDDQKKRFLYTLNKDDIKELKDNNAQLLKIVIEIKDIDNPKDEEKEKIDGVLSDYTIGKHFVVEVIKEKYQNKDDDTPKTTEKITSMPKAWI